MVDMFNQHRQTINFVAHRVNVLCERFLNIRNQRMKNLTKVMLFFSSITLFPMLYVITFGKISSEAFIYGMGVFIFSIYIIFKIVELAINLSEDESLRYLATNAFMITSRYFLLMTNERDGQNIQANRMDLMFMNLMNNLRNEFNMNNFVGRDNQNPINTETQNFWENIVLRSINEQQNIGVYHSNERPIDSISQEQITDEFCYTLDNCGNEYLSEQTLRRMYNPLSDNFTRRNPFTNLNLERITKFRIFIV
jgi:hypothetical protein